MRGMGNGLMQLPTGGLCGLITADQELLSRSTYKDDLRKRVLTRNEIKTDFKYVLKKPLL